MEYLEFIRAQEAAYVAKYPTRPISYAQEAEWRRQAHRHVQEHATVRIIFKCRRCKTVKAYDYTNALRPVRTDPSTSKLVGACEDYTCPTCGRERIANTVSGRVTDQPCGSRCMGATGPSCDCACGGANHGGAHL